MEDSRTTSERIDVLDFWWLLELFSPQALPKLTGQNVDPSGPGVIEWKPDEPLPWEFRTRRPYPNSKRRYVWRHTVYLGVYKVEDTYQELHKVFFEDRDAYDARPGGKSACAAVVIDAEGRLLAESAVLSSALWAIGRAHRHAKTNPRWADGFREAAERFDEAVDALEGERRRRHHEHAQEKCASDLAKDALSGAEEAIPYDAPALWELLRLAQGSAGIGELPHLATDVIVIKSSPVLEQQETEAAAGDFLNSFYFAEIETVRCEIAHGNIGAALAAYLTPESRIRESDRIDVRAHPHAVDAGVSAERLPKGRWPENPRYSLALSQQFAVNGAVHRLGPGAGLMGVNGPPGTGKTTMLRDILAANVVERARRFATLPAAHQAFTSEPPLAWQSPEGYPRKVIRLRPEFTGFEMVVASANNAAVENVSEEIPAAEALHEDWRAGADYFRDLATEILTGGRAQSEQEEEQPEDGATLSASDPVAQQSAAWGLIAARLGKKQHRNDFRARFWFRPKDNESRAHPLESMQDILKKWRGGQGLPATWAQARQAFNDAEGTVNRLLKPRCDAEERLRILSRLEEDRESLRARLTHHEQKAGALTQTLEGQQHAQRRAEAIVAQLKERHSRHLDLKPGLWARLQFWRSSMEPWRESLAGIVDELNSAEDQLRRIEEDGHRIRVQYESVLDDARRAAAQRDQNERSLAAVKAQLVQDKHDLGTAYPQPRGAGEGRERAAPWLDAELDEARSELFFAALDLHRAFFAATADTMLDGLRAAVDVVAGAYPRDLEGSKLQAAWQLFFLVVPLVSTTFASAGRMFSGLGKESIGWLLIDEAGQASPQYAVGSIWRARRVVAVGDPLQLQPVVTMPQKAQATIAKAYGVSDTWVPPRASVQTLADRVARYGTTLPQGEEEVWVSAPLRVHRRCDEPMFGVSNAIAYENLMVNGVRRSAESLARFDGDEEGNPPIPFSEWIDMPATVSGQHDQPEQTAKAEAVIEGLLRRGVDAKEIIAVSPFRDVATRLEAIAKKHEGVRGGTIHRAQGQQAEAVLLVLGGAADKPGAKVWAAEGPNLVNVAVSRAKRRLYVIGDRAEWKKQPYFGELAGALPVRR